MPEPQPFWTFWIDQRCLKSKDFACTCFDRDLLWYIAKWQANCNKSLILGLPSCRFISQCSWMTALNTTNCYRSEHRTFQNKNNPGWKVKSIWLFYMKLRGFIIQKSRGGCHNLQAVYLIDVWDHNVTVRGERWCGPANMLVIWLLKWPWWSNLKGEQRFQDCQLVGWIHCTAVWNMCFGFQRAPVEIDIYVAIKDDNCTSCALCLTRFL